MLPSWAAAGSFVVTPVRVDLAPNTPSAVLTVTNNEDAPLTVQLQVLAWNQADGNEHYEPTTDLLAAPPVFSLGPKEAQVIRIALRHPVNPDVEGSYRLFVEEVPGSNPQGNGIQVALRMSIPVFLAPTEEKHEGFVWQAKRSVGGVMLSIRNPGNVHERLLNLLWRTSTHSAQPLPLTYVLAGQTRVLTISEKDFGGPLPKSLHMSATSDHGPIDVEVPIEDQ